MTTTTTTPIPGVTTKEYFAPADRYAYDFGHCRDWAQLDTDQDAPYYGTWACPDVLALVCYCEGDVTIEVADNEQSFVEMIISWFNWAVEAGYKPAVDPGFDSAKIDRWTELGLEYMIH